VMNVLKLAFLPLFVFFSTVNLMVVISIFAFAPLMTTLVFIPAFFKLYNPWRSVRASTSSELLPIIRTHGKWSIIGQAFGSVTGNIRPWLIKLFINTEAVALYSLAENLVGGLKSFLPTTTLSTLIPREISNTKKSEQILLRGTKYLFIFGILIMTAGLIAVPVIVHFFIPKYAPSLPLFFFLLIIIPLSSISGMAKTFLVSLRKQKYLFYVTMFRTVGGFVLTVMLLYLFGLWGLVVERISMMILSGLLFFGYLWKNTISRESHRILWTFDAVDRQFFKGIFEIM